MSPRPIEPRGPTAPPPEAWLPLHQLLGRARRPLTRFLQIQAASGIVLLSAAALALLWANSPWAEAYTALWQAPVGITVGGFHFERSLEWVVNDGLMVIFFFVVGLEIRREIDHGELSQWRRAALPVAAAVGGMVAPATIYLAFAGAPATRAGWGAPMATDIAFALGVLTLLGTRVPPALRVLLLALAVIDDLGAIVVIALFYSAGIDWGGIGVAVAGLAGLFAMRAAGVRHKALYVVPGVVTWAGVYAAGIHPTIAGVVIGLATPVHAWLGTEGMRLELEHALRQLSAPGRDATTTSHQLSEVVHLLDDARREARSPAETLIELLHPWVAFVIMPLFALANSGVALAGLHFTPDAIATSLGITVGLVVGKPLGVIGACWVAHRIGLATLPAGLSRRHLVVLGVTAGIGFTMSLFIAQLAFTDAGLLSAAKLGILAASVVAGVLAYVIGRLALPTHADAAAAATAEEAEASDEA